MALNWVR